MSNQENSMDTLLGATQIHIDELDREIESIRTERLLRAAGPEREPFRRRARASLGRGLISLGVALGGETQARVARTAGTDVHA
jgi:hypothetical protein